MFYTDNAQLTHLSYFTALKSDDEASLDIESYPIKVLSQNEDSNILFTNWLTNRFSREEIYGINLVDDSSQLRNLIGETFDQPDAFLDHSRSIVESYLRLLQPDSAHLVIAIINNILIDDELCQGLIIGVPDDISPFLSELVSDDMGIPIVSHGFPLTNLSYGALVLYTFKDDGYRVSLKQAFGKSVEMSHLKNDLLQLRPIEDPFHQTKSYLDMCSSFVKERLSDEPGINKVDKAEILNKSISYFKNVETFNEESFLDEVLPDEDVSSAFKQYSNSYKTEKQIEIPDSFDVSQHAVKKSQKVFKSVLKLDKNFHIYIHGDKNLIKKGAEPDGRKY